MRRFALGVALFTAVLCDRTQKAEENAIVWQSLQRHSRVTNEGARCPFDHVARCTIKVRLADWAR